MIDITPLFSSDKLEISSLEEAMDVKLSNLSFGMSEFQILHFVLNKQEFPTPFALFLQARLEIYQRIQTIIDMYYQYRECVLKIELAEGRIEKIEKEEPYEKIKAAKTGLQRLEIEKNRFRKNVLISQAEDKLKEMQVFYRTYNEHRHFETDSIDVLKRAEEEYYRIKSAYYPELRDRYGMTPMGFLKLPHEDGGIEKLISMTQKQLSDIGHNMEEE